jgi:hypothetical protein
VRRNEKSDVERVTTSAANRLSSKGKSLHGVVRKEEEEVTEESWKTR